MNNPNAVKRFLQNRQSRANRNLYSFRRSLSQYHKSRGGSYRHAPKKWRPGYSRTGGYYGGAVENKFVDTQVAFGAISSVGQIVNLSVIAQGTTESTRIGRKCAINAIMVRIHAYIVSAANLNNGSDVMRIMIIQDKQVNGAEFGVLDVLETANFQSFRNLANVQRFNILKDWKIVLNASGGVGDGTTNHTVKSMVDQNCYIKRNITIEYSGPNGSITETKSNGLFILFITAHGFTAVTYRSRLRFKG